MKRFCLVLALLMFAGFAIAGPPVPPAPPASSSGDVTGAGDCASGACLDGTSDGGTYIRLYDGTSAYVGVTAGVRTATIASSVADSENLVTTLGNNDNTVTLGTTTGATALNLNAFTVSTNGVTPDAAGGATAGTAALPFSSAYIGDAATNNIQLTGTAASAKVVTLPGQTGTVTVGPTSTTAGEVWTATATAGLGAWSAAGTGDITSVGNCTTGACDGTTVTWGDATGPVVWTYSVTGTDPTITATDGAIVTNANLSLVSTGVKMTGYNGSLTFLGLGDGFDEGFTFDFNGTTNTVGVSSATGATSFNFGTMAITAASFTAAKSSGVAGSSNRYEANSTDTDYVGEIGPAAMTANTSYLLRDIAAAATSANMVQAVDGSAAASGAGTPADPWIYAKSWVDLDTYTLLDSPTFTDDISIGAAGVKLTGANGALTILGLGDGSDEDVKIDLNTTSNTIIISSPASSATAVSFSALNLLTTGAIHGAIEVISDDTSLDAAQCYGSINDTNGTETITLPAAVVGMNLVIYSNDATVKTIDPNSSEVIELSGTALTGGYAIKSPGAAGNFVALWCRSTGVWTTMGMSGVWVTNGS